MKKLLTYAIMSIFALCFMTFAGTSKVEAAKVAVVPLIISGDALEQDETDPDGSMKGMLYTDACVNYFVYPDFDLVDTDLVRNVAQEQTNIFTREAVEKIAQDTGADIVLAVSVDKFYSEEDYRHKEDTMSIDQRGKVISYNKLTGKFRSTTWRNDDVREMASIARSDFPHDSFARAIKRIVRSAVKVK